MQPNNHLSLPTIINSDGQQFHQYQQNKQTITSNLKIKHKKRPRIMTLETPQNVDVVKLANGTPPLLDYVSTLLLYNASIYSSENPSIIMRSYKEGFKVQETWYPLSTLPTMVHGLAFHTLTLTPTSKKDGSPYLPPREALSSSTWV